MIIICGTGRQGIICTTLDLGHVRNRAEAHPLDNRSVPLDTQILGFPTQLGNFARHIKMLLSGSWYISMPVGHLAVLLMFITCQTGSDCSSSTSKNTTFHILLLNTSNEECHSNVINFAVEQAIHYLDTRHDIFPEFNIEQIEGHCNQKVCNSSGTE